MTGVPSHCIREAECRKAPSIIVQPQEKSGKGTRRQLKPCIAWLIYMQDSSPKSSVWESAAKKSKVERGALLFKAKASLPPAPKAPPRIKAGNSKPLFPVSSIKSPVMMKARCLSELLGSHRNKSGLFDSLKATLTEDGEREGKIPHLETF